MNIIALVTHLKQVAQAAKAYTDSLISETAKETIKAIKEMDRAKVDKISAVAVTISTDGWVEDETWEEYPMPFMTSLPQMWTATDRADIILSPNSLTAAMDCSVCQTCETQTGKICIWAKKAPAEALTAEYQIIQGEKPKED